MDVGSGNGSPGLPIASARPLLEVVLLVEGRAAPPVAAEWCLPLARPGGAALLWVGESADLDRLARVAERLTAEPGEAPPGFALLLKTGPTPAGFPRRIGVARKRPLA